MRALVFVLSFLAIFSLPIIAQPQVVDSAQAAILLESQLEMKNMERQSYVQQLGFDPESALDAAMVNDGVVGARVLVAIGEKNYPVTVGDVYTLSYNSETGPLTLVISVPHGNSVKVPGFGAFSIANKTFVELKDEIEEEVLKYYPYGDPVLSIQRTGVFLVSVTGEAIKSTMVEAWGLSRLSSMAPYASEAASTRNVAVYSTNGEIKTYDLYRIIREGIGIDPVLKPGDKVVFAKRGTEVTISGNVNRPGTYQIMGGENLDNVLSSYAHGVLTSGNTNSISIVRYTNGDRKEYKVKVGAKFPLQDGDMISVFPSTLYLGSVTVEGALSPIEGGTTADNARTQSAITLFYRFVEGESIRSMVEMMSNYFSPSSDLSGCYLIRNGVNTPISFSDILYGSSEEGEKLLMNSDRFVIPFSQNIVTVNGAVNSTGTYGYVPGKKASYYIVRAGGMSTAAKGSDDYTITDRYGNVLGHDDEIPAEAVIEVTRDDFVRNLQPTMAVISLTAGVLGIVAASLAILLPNIY